MPIRPYKPLSVVRYAFILICLTLACFCQAASLPAGSGQFFLPIQHRGHTLELPVWYYRPTQLNEHSKVFFVMHGAERNAEGYRDQWIAHAEKHQFLLIVPEFSDKQFSVQEYQFGNIENRNPQQWTFWNIERIFAEIRDREKLNTTQYYLYGHSAGAQFVHRFMLFMPTHHVEQAFSANAGTYTMPAYNTPFAADFPMRIEPSRVSANQLKAVLGQRMVVMNGDKDVSQAGKNFPSSPAAMAQGQNRFLRGKNFFDTAQEQANLLDTPFNWQHLIVPNVAHNNVGMAKAVMQYLYPQ